MQQSDLIGLAFPVVRVRYAGPTDSRGSRYIATCRGVRVIDGYDHALNASENAYRVARACWEKYVGADASPRILIPGDLSDDSYAFTVVPTDYLS